MFSYLNISKFLYLWNRSKVRVCKDNFCKLPFFHPINNIFPSVWCFWPKSLKANFSCRRCTSAFYGHNEYYNNKHFKKINNPFFPPGKICSFDLFHKWKITNKQKLRSLERLSWQILFSPLFISSTQERKEVEKPFCDCSVCSCLNWKPPTPLNWMETVTEECTLPLKQSLVPCSDDVN